MNIEWKKDGEPDEWNRQDFTARLDRYRLHLTDWGSAFSYSIYDEDREEYLVYDVGRTTREEAKRGAAETLSRLGYDVTVSDELVLRESGQPELFGGDDE